MNVQETDSRIHAVFTPKINLSFHHNSIPTLQELAITNARETALTNVELRLTAEPAFIIPKVWRFDSIAAGASYHVDDLDVTLDGAMLGGLTEAATATVRLSLSVAGAIITSADFQVELLARNQWGGIGYVPEMISAFVQPNDPAIDQLLKKAADILRKHGCNSALNGYGGGAKHAWELASAIWAAIGALELDYALPPASFEQAGQKIREPSQIKQSRIATCLDTTLLICSALEQCGLNPIVVFTRGHSLAGVWLKNEEFTTAIVDDITALRKRVKLKELVLFETTFLTQRAYIPLSKAIDHGAKLISEQGEDKFELAVDIRRARFQRIKPLPNKELPKPPELSPPPSQTETIIEAPPDTLPDEESSGAEDETPEQPEDRLHRWQRKLLDLSLRNSLLNFRSTKKAIRLEAPDPNVLEDVLADGKVMKLLARPDLMDGADPRDLKIYEERTKEDVRREHALDALKRREVFALLANDELESRLIELYRSANAALQEGGANTLYLALGFLSWTRDSNDPKRYLAPLILIPVTLNRKSVRSGFTLALHDDEPRFNPTLLEMLRQDFHLNIPITEGELPKDHSGLDVDGIWRSVSQAIKDIRGWEVVEDVVLATFSFAKYLMWKDLKDRTDVLKQNPVVRHLIDSPRDSYPHSTPFPDPRELDDSHGPDQTFNPLPADSSQLSAIMAGAKGKDFVLVGPPGTGKSQTIANLIAQCLAENKTVIFVAEKIVALEVVYRRLQDIGLGDFCLELHSSKARKVEVLEQLGRAWQAKGDIDTAQWESEARRLKSLRATLNAFVKSLHTKRRNGLSAFDAIGRVVSGKSLPALDFSWPSMDTHNGEELGQLRELAGRLDVNAREVSGILDNPLSLITVHDWSTAWQHSLIKSAREFIPVIEAYQKATDEFCHSLGLPTLEYTQRTRESLGVLARELPKAAGKDWRFCLRPDAWSIADNLVKGDELLASHKNVMDALSVQYKDESLALDLDQLKYDWQLADSKWFLHAWWIRYKVRSALAPYTITGSIPDADKDIDRLLEIKRLLKEIESLDDLRQKTGGLWAGRKSRRPEIQAALAFQKALLPAISGLASSTEMMAKILSPVERLLGEGNLLLEPGGLVNGSASRYLESLAAFQRACTTFVSYAGSSTADLDRSGSGTPSNLSRICRQIVGLEPKLRAWCAWRKVCAEAIAHGLAPLVSAMESGAIPPGLAKDVFEYGYCRWWLNTLVDGEETLRGFVSAEHERLIEDFKNLDERFMQLTRAYIRALLSAGLPDQDDVSKNSEWGLLRHETQKKKRHLPLRELISRIPSVVTRLTPCLLMSPLSIAQYLPAATALFDVVIFDEASQIPVWDAIGALARGKQVVMVGDPKQLPPTSFFDRAESDIDSEDVEGDLESILDECMGCGIPSLNLSWHYRSRHESLIAFSNHRYYGGGLVTFPSPVTDDRAVNFTYVSGGVYEKGGARINQPEARALVADVVSRLKDPSFIESGMTVGIVTFNLEQQRLIEDLLDEERRKDPSIESFFTEGGLEPVFVKNLESVQGDERDIMYFSITFGPDLAGAISMNFGPMNREGGERRLNVAITRARHELRVFASLKPEQIDLSRTRSVGVRDLKHFMEFAERGPKALAEAVFAGLGDFESPFEKAVAEALGAKGWQVHPQVGVSSFRIDLGVVHPGQPGRYLAGIECDGATYHRAATARDRDKLREQVLRGLGWRIIRIWSTDWWLDSAGSLDKVHDRLNGLLSV